MLCVVFGDCAVRLGLAIEILWTDVAGVVLRGLFKY